MAAALRLLRFASVSVDMAAPLSFRVVNSSAR